MFRAALLLAALLPALLQAAEAISPFSARMAANHLDGMTLRIRIYPENDALHDLRGVLLHSGGILIEPSVRWGDTNLPIWTDHQLNSGNFRNLLELLAEQDFFDDASSYYFAVTRDENSTALPPEDGIVGTAYRPASASGFSIELAWFDEAWKLLRNQSWSATAENLAWLQEFGTEPEPEVQTTLQKLLAQLP